MEEPLIIAVLGESPKIQQLLIGYRKSPTADFSKPDQTEIFLIIR